MKSYNWNRLQKILCCHLSVYNLNEPSVFNRGQGLKGMYEMYPVWHTGQSYPPPFFPEPGGYVSGDLTIKPMVTAVLTGQPQETRMFRNGLVHARKILVSNHISFNFSPELSTSGCTTVYDVRRSTQDKDLRRNSLLLPADQSLLPSRHLIVQGSQSLIPIRQTLPVSTPLLSSGCLLQDNLNLRLASTSFQMPNPAEIACNLINMTRCIDLNDLKDAPPPSFWVVMATVAAQLGIPFLELVGGYSPIMTYLQLYIAAAGLAWNGGQTWGLAMSSNPKPTASWDAMNMSLIPTGFAILGLLLPYPLGFLTIASGLITSLYLDLKSCVYPPWAIAAKFLVVLSSTVGLLLALMAYVLFHNRENAKKKKSGKELPPAESDDQGEGDEKESK